VRWTSSRIHRQCVKHSKMASCVGVAEPRVVIPPVEYASFLLRLWRTRRSDAPPAWQVEIEHIQSGQRWSFDGLDEALRWLPRQAERLAHLDRVE